MVTQASSTLHKFKIGDHLIDHNDGERMEVIGHLTDYYRLRSYYYEGLYSNTNVHRGVAYVERTCKLAEQSIVTRVLNKYL